MTVSVALEFLVIYSVLLTARAVLGKDREARALTIALVLGFDLVLLASVAVLFASAWPLVAFWVQAANRMGSTLWEGRRSGNPGAAVEPWAASMCAWAGLAVVTHVVPLPRLGIGDLPGETAWMLELDLWHGEPHRAVAFATLYCLAMAASKLARHRWVRACLPDGDSWLE